MGSIRLACARPVALLFSLSTLGLVEIFSDQFISNLTFRMVNSQFSEFLFVVALALVVSPTARGVPMPPFLCFHDHDVSVPQLFVDCLEENGPLNITVLRSGNFSSLPLFRTSNLNS